MRLPLAVETTPGRGDYPWPWRPLDIVALMYGYTNHDDICSYQYFWPTIYSPSGLNVALLEPLTQNCYPIMSHLTKVKIDKMSLQHWPCQIPMVHF